MKSIQTTKILLYATCNTSPPKPNITLPTITILKFSIYLLDPTEQAVWPMTNKNVNINMPLRIPK